MALKKPKQKIAYAVVLKRKPVISILDIYADKNVVIGKHEKFVKVRIVAI